MITDYFLESYSKSKVCLALSFAILQGIDVSLIEEADFTPVDIA
jgi:hypothetical protein